MSAVPGTEGASHQLVLAAAGRGADGKGSVGSWGWNAWPSAPRGPSAEFLSTWAGYIICEGPWAPGQPPPPPDGPQKMPSGGSREPSCAPFLKSSWKQELHALNQRTP